VPLPRDFHNERFRLASTENAMPTLADLAAVIQRGMPGTSMPAFGQFTDSQRMLLAEEVMQLHRRGVRQRLVQSLRDEYGSNGDDKWERLLEQAVTPGRGITVPVFSAATSQAIARGEELFAQFGCRNCHAPVGSTEAASAFLLDEQGRRVWPRDLAHDPFKGGHSAESVYLRIRLGMPGTLHPASASLSDEQAVNLVAYCLSLSREPKWVTTNYQRSLGPLPPLGRQPLPRAAGADLPDRAP
jgi:cytochrome c oxidase cbb3-type subunit 2